MHDGVVVSVVRGAQRVARAQAAQVRAVGGAAHAHAADEPAPRPHHLPHRRCGHVAIVTVGSHYPLIYNMLKTLFSVNVAVKIVEYVNSKCNIDFIVTSMMITYRYIILITQLHIFMVRTKIAKTKRDGAILLSICLVTTNYYFQLEFETNNKLYHSKLVWRSY